MVMNVYVAVIVTVLALNVPTYAQADKPESRVQKLRNVAAVDAANALTKFVEQKKLTVSVAVEPVSNSVTLVGDAASVRQLTELLISIDKQPPTVHMQIVTIEAPAGFIEGVGLAESDESSWSLTPLEARMLLAAVDSAQARQEVEILSRPRMILTDNQTGFMQIGENDVQSGKSLTTRVTPRIGSDGTLLLRVETQVIQALQGKIDNQSNQATEKVVDGGTMVMRGARTKGADGKTREKLFIVTANRVRTESPKK